MNEATQRIALIILGLLALAVVVGGIILSIDDKAIPDALIAIGAGAAGAVGGIVTTKLPG